MATTVITDTMARNSVHPAMQEVLDFERAAGQLFGSPTGQLVLKEMIKRTEHKLFDSDPLKMAYKVGMLEMLFTFQSYVRTE